MYDDILIFIKLVDNMSFGKTAIDLKTTQSTISRRIKALEDELELKLLVRDTRNLKLTEEGQQLYFSFREQENFLIKQINNIKMPKQPNQGSFSLSLPFSLSHGAITPLIAKFLAAYPEINIEAHYGVVKANIIADVDVAISLVKPKTEDSEYYLLATRKVQAYCSPTYIKQHGLPTSIEELLNGEHRYMGVTNANDGIDEFIYLTNAITKETVQIKNRGCQFISNSPLHAAEFGVHSDMIVWGWDSVFSEYLQSKRLIKVLPEYYFKELPLYLIKRNKNSMIVDTFTQFIRSNIQM
jgi:DNA-binding transcriptional LysR family regulator